jgi:hypothetical protein
MIIERIDNELVIRIPDNVNTEGLQEFLDYLIYKDATSASRAKQADVDTLARDVKRDWWEKNKERFVK